MKKLHLKEKKLCLAERKIENSDKNLYSWNYKQSNKTHKDRVEYRWLEHSGYLLKYL